MDKEYSNIKMRIDKMDMFTYTVKNQHPKVGRNQLCHCGSGKKYKKCCLSVDKSVEMDFNPQTNILKEAKEKWGDNYEKNIPFANK